MSSLTTSRSMNHIRTLSPSSRQNAHENYSKNIFITTNCDKKHSSHENITPFPDEDLIFYMSPIHSHQPVTTTSPSFHSLYSFPRPPNNTGRREEQVYPDNSSQSAHFLEHPTAASPALSQDLIREQNLVANLPRPFATSLLNTNIPPREANHVMPTPPNTPQPVHLGHASSPIPIPCIDPRRSELGAAVSYNISLESQSNGSLSYLSENTEPSRVRDSQFFATVSKAPVQTMQTNFR